MGRYKKKINPRYNSSRRSKVVEDEAGWVVYVIKGDRERSRQRAGTLKSCMTWRDKHPEKYVVIERNPELFS